jgi:hypothetical protein
LEIPKWEARTSSDFLGMMGDAAISQRLPA